MSPQGARASLARRRSLTAGILALGSLLWAGAVCGLLALACSPSEPTGGADGAGRGARETAVVVVLDSVSSALLHGSGEEEMRQRTPRLARFAEASIRYERHLAVSTGTQASMATLLTGVPPAEHGLASLRLRGRGRLDAGIETHAERFREAGFATLAAVALPQLRHGLSGLLRGFERVFEPGLNVRAAWTGTDLWTRFGAAFEAELASDRPVFAVVVLGDGRAHLRRSSRPSGEVLLRHMTPFQDQDPRVREALELVEEDPFLALEELDRILGRSRGSSAFRALQAARHDAVLASLDRGFGRLLDLLEASGRADEATVCVVGGALAESDGSFELAGMWTPCMLRLRGERESATVTDLIQTPRLFHRILEAHGIALPTATAHVPKAAVCTLRDRNAGIAVAPPLWMEEDTFGVRQLFRSGAAEPLEPSGIEAAERSLVEDLAAALDASLIRPTWTVDADLDAPLDVGWTFFEGGGRPLSPAPNDAPRFEARGGGTLAGSEPVLEWLASAPDLPLRLRFEGEAFAGRDVAAIHLGRRSVRELPALWLPIDRRSEPTGQDAPADAPADDPGAEDLPRVDVDHAGGGWWTVAVRGARGAPVRTLVALVPPDDLDRELELQVTEGDARIEAVEGRFDALWVVGKAPVTLRCKKEPASRLGLHASVDGTHLTPWQLHQGGRAFAHGVRVALYLPDWLPGLTDCLDGAPGEAPGEQPGDAGEAPPAGGLRVRRAPSGSPAARDRTPFDRAQLSFVRRLGENE